MSQDLHVRDVLNARAEFDHELSIATIAPAAVIVLELEAPPRLELLASTESEHDALRTWAERDPRALHVLAAYFDIACDERRENEHAARLTNGQRMTVLRVSNATT